MNYRKCSNCGTQVGAKNKNSGAVLQTDITVKPEFYLHEIIIIYRRAGIKEKGSGFLQKRHKRARDWTSNKL